MMDDDSPRGINFFH